MGEYQYYEFLALDRPLTEKQRAELWSISTRAEITATRFVNMTQAGEHRSASAVDLMIAATAARGTPRISASTISATSPDKRPRRLGGREPVQQIIAAFGRRRPSWRGDMRGRLVAGPHSFRPYVSLVRALLLTARCQ